VWLLVDFRSIGGVAGSISFLSDRGSRFFFGDLVAYFGAFLLSEDRAHVVTDAFPTIAFASSIASYSDYPVSSLSLTFLFALFSVYEYGSRLFEPTSQ